MTHEMGLASVRRATLYASEKAAPLKRCSFPGRKGAMEPANAAEMELLQVKVDAAQSRLKKAQVNLTSVLNLLSDLPAALKTGVMRVIEDAFEDLGEAEKHVLELNDIVRARALTFQAVAPSDRCPHCSRPYQDATSSSREPEAASVSGRAR